MILPELTTTTENIHIKQESRFGNTAPATIKINLDGKIIQASKSFLRFMAMDKDMVVGRDFTNITSFENQEVNTLIDKVHNGSVVASEIVFKSVALKKYVSGIFTPTQINESENAVDLQLSF